MNLMFWKKKPKNGDEADQPQEAADDKTVAMEVPDLGTPAKAGLLTRVQAGLAGLALRFKKPVSDQEGDAENQAPNAHGSPGNKTDDTLALRHIRTKKRLIMGGAIGLLVLLLTGMGFATWKIFLSPAEQDTAALSTADTSHDSQPAEHATAKQAEAPEAEIEALRKKNDELQAQIAALKKGQSQDQPSAPAAGASGENPVSASSTGELTISNKDPKAAAQTLKEAIESMNANAGGPARKSTK